MKELHSSISLCINPFVYPCVHLSIHLSICLSICPFAYPSVHLSIHLPINILYLYISNKLVAHAQMEDDLIAEHIVPD